MAEITAGETRLAALGEHLSACGLKVDLTAFGLRVTAPNTAGCRAGVRHRGDKITCRSRSGDGGAPWFYTSWGEPISPAEDLVGATMFVLGYLAERPHEVAVAR